MVHLEAAVLELQQSRQAATTTCAWTNSKTHQKVVDSATLVEEHGQKLNSWVHVVDQQQQDDDLANGQKADGQKGNGQKGNGKKGKGKHLIQLIIASN